jgi:hypothetical protein
MFVNLWREVGEDLVTQAVDLILDKYPNLESKEELTKKVKNVPVHVFGGGRTKHGETHLACGRRAALAETYEKVLQATPTRAVRLNISVKLDTIGLPKERSLISTKK